MGLGAATCIACSESKLSPSSIVSPACKALALSSISGVLSLNLFKNVVTSKLVPSSFFVLPKSLKNSGLKDPPLLGKIPCICSLTASLILSIEI